MSFFLDIDNKISAIYR